MTLVEALDREWRELVHGCPVAATCWFDRHPAFAVCRLLDDILPAGKVDPIPSLPPC